MIETAIALLIGSIAFAIFASILLAIYCIVKILREQAREEQRYQSRKNKDILSGNYH